MNAEIGELAAAAAAAVVTAMATDGWEGVRFRVASLFRRLGPDRARAAERQLEHHEDQVRKAADPDTARQALLGAWTLEMGELLEGAPDAVDPLRALVAEFTGRLTPSQRDGYLHQVSIATGYGRVFSVQNGNIYLHARPSRSSADPAATEAGDVD